MPDFRLETERLILREWRDDDLDALAAMGQDAAVMATLGPLMDRAASADLMERLRAMNTELGHTFWAIERKADGRMIGFTGIIRGRDGPIEGKLEIGWRLASDTWGHGYASEAARAALGWAAANRPGEDVYAITAVTNARSRAVMERLGMTYQPGLDFDHPRVAEGSPLRRHVTYRKAMG
ncbi:MAG: GNAT family N-acetyltransferase [Tsuneonella sp.]